MGFCPKCGKKQNNFVLCKDCKEVKFEVKDFKVVFCATCNSFMHKNVWKSYEDNVKAIEVVLKDNTKQEFDLIFNEEPELKPGIKKNIMAIVVVEGVEIEFSIDYEVTLCNNCKAATTQGFEGILQFRGDPLEERNKLILAYIKDEILSVSKRGIYCIDEQSSKHGFDFYLTDKGYIATLARRLQTKFGGTISLNEQLFTRNHLTSRDVFRLNVLYQAPKYKKNDVIVISGRPAKIVSMSKDIMAIDLTLGAKSTYRYSEDYELLEKMQSTVSNVYPDIEVLDVETYESVKVKNPLKKEVQLDYNCKYVKFGTDYYLV